MLRLQSRLENNNSSQSIVSLTYKLSQKVTSNFHGCKKQREMYELFTFMEVLENVGQHCRNENCFERIVEK